MPRKRGATITASAEVKPKKEQKESPEIEEKPVIDKTVQKIAAHSKKYLGVHVTAAGGVEHALIRAAAIGCRSMALFLRNRRRWEAAPLKKESVEKWKKLLPESGIDPAFIVPHSYYFMNFASPNPDLRKRSVAVLLDELRRCEKLGIQLYNIHAGSTTGKCSFEEGVKHVAAILDDVLEKTSGVTILIETMAGQGHMLGGTFEEIRAILDAVKPAHADRVAVCLDTCHIFAGGYDIRSSETYEATVAKFGEVIGFDKLKAVHLNDCKSDLDSHLDRHQHIPKGNLKSLWPIIMADPRLDNIPLILETPEGRYQEEVEYLYKLDPGSGVKKEV